MINGHKIWFLTFSDKRFDAWKRLKKEAEMFGVFDTIVAGTERMFEPWYAHKYASRFPDRGFGFWQWKSYLIRQQLEKMDEGDVILYCDAGCSFNIDGRKRFEDYINIVTEHPSGVLLFDQGMNVREWTKGDVFHYFGDEETYASHDQVFAGIILICKNAKSCAMFDEWYYICHNHYELISEAPSVYPNFPEYIENRFDQSVLDLLAVKYCPAVLSLSEAYRLDEDWSQMKEYPIWVTRNRIGKTTLLSKIVTIVKSIKQRK